MRGLGFMCGVAVGVAATAALQRWRRDPQAHLDALTRLPTRRAADAALGSLRRGDAVVMIDIDTLKATNDAFGHGAGDVLLSSVADYLSTQVRAGDTVARWGGDEFVVILRGGGAAAVDVVERLRVSAPAAFSAGVAVHDGGRGDATLAAADAALLDAKRAGGSRVVMR